MFGTWRTHWVKRTAPRLSASVDRSHFSSTSTARRASGPPCSRAAETRSSRIRSASSIRVECLYSTSSSKLTLSSSANKRAERKARGQYDGGPGPNASFIYDHNTLYFATDAFALDRTCHDLLVAKRKDMGVEVNEHPRFSEYLDYGESLGLGIADPAKIKVFKA